MNFNDYLQQGIIFFQESNFGKALENFEAALELQPDNADIKALANGCRQNILIQEQKAQASANEAIHRAEVIGIKVTDVDKVIAEYTEALRHNANDFSAKSKLASVYYIRGLTFNSKGEHTRAIEDYSEAIKNEPEYTLAFNKRGWTNLETGNYDQAIKDFEKVIQFKPDDAQPKQNLANAYLQRGIEYDKKGDYARAIADFEMVLKYKPDDNTARELLEMAKAEMAKNK